MKKEGMGLSLAKLILTVSFIIGGGAWLGTVAYSLAHPEFAVNFGQIINPTPAEKTVNKIEISADAKSIINAENRAVIFTIADTQKYLKNSVYFYNPDTFQTTNAKYEGDCFLSAALSNNKDRIVFSTGCLAGDLPQAWIGVYDIPDICAPSYPGSGGICYPLEKNHFLIAGFGKNFIWSSDDKTITYEADLGLSGMTETRTIDSATGEILERKNQYEADTSTWKIYRSEKYGFEIKYPINLYVASDFAADNMIDFSEYKNPPDREYPGIRIQINNFLGDFKEYIDETIKNNLESSNDIYGCNNSVADIAREELNIDSANGVKLKGFCGYENVSIFFVKSNKLYIISNSYSDDMLFKKILSTFKFIEPEK